MATKAVVGWRVAEVRIISLPSRDFHMDDVYFSHFSKADPNISYMSIAFQLALLCFVQAEPRATFIVSTANEKVDINCNR
jgi:hypothetical protein